ncbi:MAG: hypothetical protein DWP92_01850 [Armatimonadetes bacterium]|nr:MAG: hypothetical protein DWP92_01850 [Armatimonadota bacterium]
MTVMEPKLAERRKGVSEDRARSRLKGVLIVIVLLSLVVGAIWLIRSPVLSIRAVDVSGAELSNPLFTVSELAMGQGTPTIDVDASAIESAIALDPWVKDVKVVVSWPGTISIAVVEYTPYASVMAADRFVSVADDGAVLTVGDPLAESPRIEIDAGPVSPGYDITNPLIVGAIDFSAALPREMAAQVVVSAEGEGLVATLLGFRVILGRPVDMEEKAIVFASLIESGLEPGSQVNLIAPLRPAVTNPQPLPEPEE